MFMVKSIPTALIFGYNYVLLVHFLRHPVDSEKDSHGESLSIEELSEFPRMMKSNKSSNLLKVEIYCKL